MSLHIIIGFDGPQKSCPPSLVYLGTKPSDSEAAMRASTARRFIVLRNPHGFGKNNPHCEANRVAASAAAGDSARAEKELSAQMADEILRLQNLSAERAAKIAELEARLAAHTPATVQPNSSAQEESSPTPPPTESVSQGSAEGVALDANAATGEAAPRTSVSSGAAPDPAPAKPARRR